MMYVGAVQGLTDPTQKFAKGSYVANYVRLLRDTLARFHARTMAHRTTNTALELFSLPPAISWGRQERSWSLWSDPGAPGNGRERPRGGISGEYLAWRAYGGEIFGSHTFPTSGRVASYITTTQYRKELDTTKDI
eukprot:6201280-Pleurochrysis_carterae.AAC.18